MTRFTSMLAASAALAVLPLASAPAMPIAQDLAVSPQITHVADGCGPGAWRGPWGHVVTTPYVAPLPAMHGNGCPAGSWRGLWGHCRDTPYHGRLPDGLWQ